MEGLLQFAMMSRLPELSLVLHSIFWDNDTLIVLSRLLERRIDRSQYKKPHEGMWGYSVVSNDYSLFQQF